MHANSKRIGIDIRSMSAAGLGRGMATYAANLVTQVVRFAQEEQVYLFVSRDQDVPPFLVDGIVPSNVQVIRLRRPTRNIFFWDQLLWYPLLKRLRIDVFHSLAYGVPLWTPCPTIATIYDLTPLLFPQFIQHLRHHLVFRINFFTGKHARRIITLSAWSQRDLVQHLHVPPEKITVIFPGVSPQYRVLQAPQSLAAIRIRYQLPEKFILYVGGFDQNKNLLTLVQAFRLLTQSSDLREPVSLVFVGTLHPMAKVVQRAVQTSGLEAFVRFTGFVPEQDLIGIYNAAYMFVFPSLYEGFGLPPLEAMACGTPAVVSSAASLPEVVGDAALQVDPTSSEALAAAMRTLLTTPELHAQLRQQGLSRAQGFSWERAARQTLAVYREICV